MSSLRNSSIATGSDRPERAALIGAFGAVYLFWGSTYLAIPLWMTLLQGLRSGAAVLGARTLIGIAGGFLGLLVLVGPEPAPGGTPVDRTAAAVILLGALSWAVGSSWSQRAPRPASQTLATGIYLLTGGALLLLLALGTGETRRLDLAALSARSVLALGYLILFGSIVTFRAYTWLLEHATLSSVGTHAYVNPLVTVFLGWSLGGEALTGRVLAAAVMVVSAVALTLKGQAARRRRTAAIAPGRGTERCISRWEET